MRRYEGHSQSFFFLSGFCFTETDESQDSGGKKGTIFYSTLPLPPAHKHSDIYLQLCMWDDYHIFLTATLVFTRLLFDEILPSYRITIWLIDDVKFDLVYFLDDLTLGFYYSNLDIGNQWTRTRIDYRPCITNEPSITSESLQANVLQVNHFHISWTREKTKYFLTFSGGMEIEQFLTELTNQFFHVSE